jgi:hypothetical protein
LPLWPWSIEIRNVPDPLPKLPRKLVHVNSEMNAPPNVVSDPK